MNKIKKPSQFAFLPYLVNLVNPVDVLENITLA